MQKKKGISLIVLVITIIVMIVLAGAIILSLNNSGIIGKANEAVRDTDEATVRELAQMAWAEAYADGVRTVEGDNGLKVKVEEALKVNDVNTEGNIDYFLNVTTKGVTVKPIEEAWVLNREELKVKRGEEELTIGQEVKYESGVEGYTGGWKVLGADEDGNLLIVSATNVNTSYVLGYDSAVHKTNEVRLKECQKDWLYGVKELDNICSVYGKGTGAISARNITVEDVNKVTGYNPMTAVNGKPYCHGSSYQYGNTVTYSYNGTTQPVYSSAVRSGILSATHDNGFYYCNGEKSVCINNLLEGTNGKIFATLTSNYYDYTGSEYLERTSAAYFMLFGDDDIKYWLASPYIYTSPGSVSFGLLFVRRGMIAGDYLFLSSGNPSMRMYDVRAVVTLSSDIPLADLINN